ncbi:MAG: sugar ABC transporter permease, partial [Pseudomonadota bacterium]
MTDFPAQSKPRSVGRVTRSYASLRSISALMLREMATRYGRSPGGYLWSIVEPLGMILILAVAFAALVRVPPLGDSFIIFFATGYLIFQLYNTVSGAIARAINFSRSLLFYPAVTWIDAVLGRFFLNFLTELLVLFLLLVVLFAITDVTLFLDIRPILIAIAMAATL